MLFGVVSGVGQGMGVLDGDGDRRRGRSRFWVNLGRPIVTNGPLLRSCAEVHEAIKLSFGKVSGVGPAIDVLDGGPRATRGRGCFWDFSTFVPPLV